MMDAKNLIFVISKKSKASSAENLLTLRRRRSAFIGYITGLTNKISEKLPLTILKRLSAKLSSCITC